MDPYEEARAADRELTETARRLEAERLRLEAELRRVGERTRLVRRLRNPSPRPSPDDATA